jgi:hypothetical protein
MSKQERITNRVSDILAWYRIAKTITLDDLDAKCVEMLGSVRFGCEHEWGPWRGVDMEMVCGFVLHYERTCAVCGLEERSNEKPQVDYAIKVALYPNHF